MPRLNTLRTKRPILFSAAVWTSGFLMISATAAVLRGQAPAPHVSFTQAQASSGSQVYTQKCASCHGARLDDGAAPPLAGTRFLQAWSTPGRTVEDLFFIIRTTMPKNEGGTLTPSEYASVLAHLLSRNGYAAGDRELPAEQGALSPFRLTAPSDTAADKTAPPEYIAGTGGTAPRASGPRHEDLLAATSRGRDWLMHTHDYSGTRFSPLTQITPANVARLHVVCAYQVGETGNFQTGPIVDRGTMYVTSIYATIAIDATTCRPKWRHLWAPRGGEIFNNNRGVSVKDGRVVRATSDGYLMALDAEDGRLLWARRIAEAAKGETFTMAPLIYDNLIVIGPAVSEWALKGWVGAFRLDNGERVWRFNIVPAPGDRKSVV